MKLTPLYQKHLDLGATMYTTAMGYLMPAYYSSVEEEARNVRQRVGMNDVSLMGRLDVKGKDALALIQYLIVNNAAGLTDGQALYSVMCGEDGLIVDDVVVQRHAALEAADLVAGLTVAPSPDDLAFNEKGELAAGLDAVEIQLCDARGDVDTGGDVAAGRWIQIGKYGQPRLSRKRAEIQSDRNSLGGC